MRKHTLQAINSKRDFYGNCSFAFIYVDENGKEVRATISGGESNIRSIITAAGWNWNDVYFTVKELKIREFNKFVKGWDYAGCTPKELLEFINKKIAENNYHG